MLSDTGITPATACYQAYADIATRNRAVRRARRQERGAAPLEDHASAGASKSDEEDVGTAPANAAEERLVQQMLVTSMRESRMSPYVAWRCVAM